MRSRGLPVRALAAQGAERQGRGVAYQRPATRVPRVESYSESPCRTRLSPARGWARAPAARLQSFGFGLNKEGGRLRRFRRRRTEPGRVGWAVPSSTVRSGQARPRRRFSMAYRGGRTESDRRAVTGWARRGRSAARGPPAAAHRASPRRVACPSRPAGRVITRQRCVPGRALCGSAGCRCLMRGRGCTPAR